MKHPKKEGRSIRTKRLMQSQLYTTAELEIPSDVNLMLIWLFLIRLLGIKTVYKI